MGCRPSSHGKIGASSATANGAKDAKDGEAIKVDEVDQSVDAETANNGRINGVFVLRPTREAEIRKPLFYVILFFFRR